ncbi:MAG: S9 family peptidase [Sinobacteraceae bacterium]|nr:S9 family peptidase [Nevskiaceae bacterium]
MAHTRALCPAAWSVVIPIVLTPLSGCHSRGHAGGNGVLNQPAAPPVAVRHAHRVESPHGAREDDYYWLRDDARASPEVLDYLKAENAYTDAMLAHTRPLQEQIYKEIVSRIKQDDATVPYRRKGYWYYRRYDTGKEYPIYARRRGALDAAEEVMLDANELGRGLGFYAIGGWAVSPDNRLLAWTEDTVGRRQYTLRVKNLATGELFADKVSGLQPEIVWAADNRTLLYIANDPTTLLGDKVRKHVLGTGAAEDPLVFEQTDKTFYTQVAATKDEQFVTILSHSTVSDEVQVARASDPQLHFTVLIPRERDHEYEIEHRGDQWLIRTNWQAKNFRIVAVAERQVGDRKAWRDVLPHRADAFIDGFEVFQDFIGVEEHSNGLSNIRILPLRGAAYLIDSPEPAYTTRLLNNEEFESKLLRYTYTSMTTPLSTYDFDVTRNQKKLLKQDPVLGGFDQHNYVTEHVWATARDGTQVPISLVYRHGFKRDGTAPLLQYGYGSYGISTDPTFSYTAISLLDRGFVYAIAHVRGGQEMGRSWYESGKLLKKRNTFTDFVDVTHFLVQQKYVAPDRTFALGGSAGGLLMGAVANMAPQEYRGIIALVPFVDVVTTMLDESIPLTTNEFDEWGNPRQKPFYDYMLSYSPYDNVAAQGYPALFVGTGLWDSQVQYYEPAKWVARLRQMKTDRNPLVFRINMQAGHGGKSGRFQKYHDIAEQYAFMLDLVGAEARTP